MKGIAKIRLFYSSNMALILPQLKDIINFVLKLICSLFTMFMSVCFPIYNCHKFTRSIDQNIHRVNNWCYFDPHPNRVNKLIFIKESSACNFHSTAPLDKNCNGRGRNTYKWSFIKIIDFLQMEQQYIIVVAMFIYL